MLCFILLWIQNWSFYVQDGNVDDATILKRNQEIAVGRVQISVHIHVFLKCLIGFTLRYFVTVLLIFKNASLTRLFKLNFLNSMECALRLTVTDFMK